MVKAVVEVVVKHKPEDYAVKYYKDNEIILIQIDLQSFDDIDHLEERLQHPTKVAFCLSPVCEICGKRKIRHICGSSIPIVGNAEIR